MPGAAGNPSGVEGAAAGGSFDSFLGRGRRRPELQSLVKLR
jgi:hypothetical protein